MLDTLSVRLYWCFNDFHGWSVFKIHCQVSEPPSRPWTLLYISKLRVATSPKVLCIETWADRLIAWLLHGWALVGFKVFGCKFRSDVASELSELSGQIKTDILEIFRSFALSLCLFQFSHCVFADFALFRDAPTFVKAQPWRLRTCETFGGS